MNILAPGEMIIEGKELMGTSLSAAEVTETVAQIWTKNQKLNDRLIGLGRHLTAPPLPHT